MGRWALLPILALLLCPGGVASAAPGELDPTFGGAGMVTRNVDVIDYATGAAVQADGQIVVVGFTRPTLGGTNDVLVMRLNPDGSPDQSFGSGGTVVRDLGGDEQAHAVAIQPDGKIIIVAYSVTAGDIIVMRLNADGQQSSGFGFGGGMMTVGLGYDDVPEAVAIQPDGKIVIAGSSKISANNSDVAVARLKANGLLDTDFGNIGLGGARLYDLGAVDGANGVAIQPDGKIVLGGYRAADGVVTDTDFAALRVDASGVPDPAFGNGGVAVRPVGGSDRAFDVAVQPDGKILLAGTRNVGTADIAVARLTTNGEFDPAFGNIGNGGATAVDLGSAESGNSMALQPDGKILVGGNSLTGFLLARFLPDGSLDAGFGAGGVTSAAFSGGPAVSFATTLQADGRAVMAGLVENGVSSDVALARFLGDAPGGGDGGGDTGTDTTAPRHALAGKRVQDIDKLAVRVSSDESASLDGQATVKLRGGKRKVLASRHAIRSVAPGGTLTLRLKFARRKLAAIKRALAGGPARKATITVTATDAVGNASTATKTVKVTN